MDGGETGVSINDIVGQPPPGRGKVKVVSQIMGAGNMPLTRGQSAVASIRKAGKPWSGKKGGCKSGKCSRMASDIPGYEESSDDDDSGGSGEANYIADRQNEGFDADDFRRVLSWLTGTDVDLQSAILEAMEAIHGMVTADPEWREWWKDEHYVDRLGLILETAYHLGSLAETE